MTTKDIFNNSDQSHICLTLYVSLFRSLSKRSTSKKHQTWQHLKLRTNQEKYKKCANTRETKQFVRQQWNTVKMAGCTIIALTIFGLILIQWYPNKLSLNKMNVIKTSAISLSPTTAKMTHYCLLDLGVSSISSEHNYLKRFNIWFNS